MALPTIFLWLTPFNSSFVSSLFLSGLLFVLGVISDLLYVYAKVWGTTIGKALLLLLYVTISTVAYALSAQIVNEVVGFEPSKQLSYAVTFVAILLVPFFVFAATYILFAIIFILGQFYLFLAMHAEALKRNECFKNIVPTNIEPFPGRTFAARLVIYPVALGFLWGAFGHLGPKYQAFVERATATFVFHLEAVKYSRCSVPDGAKAIVANDGEVIIATQADGGYRFEPKACEARIAPNKAM